MLQALLIKFATDVVLDFAIEQAKEAVKETDNDIDDQFVKVLEDNRGLLVDKIKRRRRGGRR